MKAIGIIARILTVLAAVVGAIYALATYGEQIVAWAKKIMASLSCCTEEASEEAETEEEPVEEAVEQVVEEAAEAVEEAVETAEEAVEETVEAAEEVVADETDFEG